MVLLCRIPEISKTQLQKKIQNVLIQNSRKILMKNSIFSSEEIFFTKNKDISLGDISPDICRELRLRSESGTRPFKGVSGHRAVTQIRSAFPKMPQAPSAFVYKKGASGTRCGQCASFSFLSFPFSQYTVVTIYRPSLLLSVTVIVVRN